MMNEEEKKAIGNLKIIAEYIGENYFFGKQGIENLKKDIFVTLNYLNYLQKELEQEKEKNKKLNLENQALFENINCNDDNMLARRYQKLQKELEKSNNRIDMCIDLLNGEGCLNFDTKQEKLDYIDKLIKLEEEDE